jgi:hypothetical protein
VGQAPPAKQEVTHDQEVRQRAAERTSSFKNPPPAQPAQKAPESRNAGAQRKSEKDDKKR